jgi:c-di-GMP-binding flagellar brake protein YcgR
MSNARKHKRRQLPLLVQYRFSVLEEFHTDYSVNISGGGLFLQMPRAPVIGSTIYLQFIMRGGGRIIQCRGRVIRTDLEGKESGCAVQFIDLDDEDLAAITALVNQPVTPS